MTFANPEFGSLFFVVLHYISTRVAGQRFFLDHSSLEGMKKLAGRVSTIRWTHILRYLGLALFIIALMRPQEGEEREQVPESGIDIVLAVDTSGSMKALDFEYDGERVNRLSVVVKVIKDFIQKKERGSYVSCHIWRDSLYLISFDE